MEARSSESRSVWRKGVAYATLITVALLLVYLVGFHRRLVIRGYIAAVERASTPADELEAFRRIGSAPKRFLALFYDFGFYVVLLDESGERVPLTEFEMATRVEIHWEGGYTATRVLLNKENISGLFPYRFFKMMHERKLQAPAGRHKEEPYSK